MSILSARRIASYSADAARVLFCCGGGLGNMLQATPAIAAAVSLYREVDVYAHPAFAVPLIRDMPGPRRVSGDPDAFIAADYQLAHRTFLGRLPPHISNLPLATSHSPLRSRLHESVVALSPLFAAGFRGPVARTYCGYDPPRDVPDGLLIGLHAGGSDRAEWPKRYPPNLYTKTCDAICERAPQARFVLFGTRRDDLVRHPRVLDYRGRGTLREQAGLIRECAAMLSNDSGLGHVAGALGVPTVVVFGPTAVWKNLPRGNVRAIRVPTGSLACQPCQVLGPRPCELACLRQLRPRAVAELVLHQLDPMRFPDPADICPTGEAAAGLAATLPGSK